MTSSGANSRDIECANFKALYLLKYMFHLVQTLRVARKGTVRDEN